MRSWLGSNLQRMKLMIEALIFLAGYCVGGVCGIFLVAFMVGAHRD